MTTAIGQIRKRELLDSFEAMLAFFYGEVATSTIEKLSPSPLNSFSVSDIKAISKELGLDMVYKKMPYSAVQKHMLPAMALSSSGEALMLISFDENIATIKRSKESPKEVISRRELEAYDRFVFISKPDKESEVLKTGDEKDKSWFYNPIKKEWRSYVEIGVLTFFINIFGLALPLFTMNVYNRVIPNFATETLFVLAFGVGMILLFDVVLKSARVHILEGVTKKLANHFEEELFQKSLSLQSQYDNYLVGTKTNLFRELSGVKDFFATKIISVLDVPFFFIAMLVIYIISPMMVVVPMVAAFLSLSFNFFMQFPIAKLHKQHFEDAQSKQAFLVEQLQGQDAIKLANALPKRTQKWRRIVNFYNHIQGKIQFLNGVSSFISYSLLQAVSLGTVIVGVFAIHDGLLSVGGLIAVTILAARAMVPVMALSNILIKYKQVKEGLNSLNNYWHLPSESQKYTELGMGRVRGDISFEDVSFAYPNANYPSVSNISFSIKAGERVGIIGQTGAGKSTIQKLLTGLEKPSSGQIFIDDMNIESIHPVELRENIALMPQEPYIFSGTLKENLELSRSVSKHEMSLLLAKTGLANLVRKAGSADDFQVGERGSNLSVGQRHLVALARAMMSDAPILILDEPTTGLDVGLEKQLVEHLDTTLEDKTVVVITHRFAALELVDRVILIHDGKVVADGAKDKVLAMLQGGAS
jgi:ATP-binding cassette subfamily B protein/ATP-binding cassette subfamily C protein LapB